MPHSVDHTPVLDRQDSTRSFRPHRWLLVSLLAYEFLALNRGCSQEAWQRTGDRAQRGAIGTSRNGSAGYPHVAPKPATPRIFGTAPNQPSRRPILRREKCRASCGQKRLLAKISRTFSPCVQSHPVPRPWTYFPIRKRNGRGASPH